MFVNNESNSYNTKLFIHYVCRCVTTEAGPKGSKVVLDFSGDPASNIQLRFKVFKFLRTYQVSFRSNVKLCKDEGNSTQCDIAVSLTSPSAIVTRKSG